MSLYASNPVPADTPCRIATTILPPDSQTPSFVISLNQNSYKYQYSNIYFIRLRHLRPIVEVHAREKWSNIEGNPELVSRVLDVDKGKLCYVIGTVYMEMPLKPNVMEDIARDTSIAPPPPPTKFYSPEDTVTLEDESGRIRLVGSRAKEAKLVTGVIVGALGMETPNGDFEVIDICYPEMAPQPRPEPANEDTMDIDDTSDTPDEWIAAISGLSVGAVSPSDAEIQMLVEYLTGESGDVDGQLSPSNISRLIIAGDSLAPAIPLVAETSVSFDDRKARRYGYDATTFSPHPVLSLSASLTDLATSMPIHILPGETDPSGTIMPQQPFPRAMFGDAARFQSFNCETNPTYLTISTDPEPEASSSKSSRPAIKRKLLVNSGQPLNDMFKYLPSPPNTRLSVLESTLRWRHMAPTAPDTLWCHPYKDEDPFMITETPDIYIVGGQKKFGTKLVVDQQGKSKQKGGPNTTARCRIVMVPNFSETGILVLINLRTLDVKCIKFAVTGMTTGGHVKDEPTTNAPSPTSAEPQSSGPKKSMDYDFI